MSEDHIAVKINGALYVKLEDAQKLRDALDKAEAENARLREALRQISKGDVCVAVFTHPPICSRALAARAALGEKE